MLSDRFYMRDDYPRRGTSVLTWICCALGAGFILQLIFQRWGGYSIGNEMEGALALSITGLRAGHLWTLLTYALLHGGILHILGNLLGIYFFGREVITYTGERRFLSLFLASIALGGLFFAAANWHQGGAVIGASAAVSCLLVVYACLNPNQPITLLLFFILPVTIRPKYLAWGMLAIDLVGLLFYEILGGHLLFGWAHSAHLGGMAAGWIYFRYVHQREWRFPDQRTEIELPKWFKRARKAPPAAQTPAYKVNLTTRESLRAEVDRILDKINSQGFGALSAEEKRILDEAKDLLSRP